MRIYLASRYSRYSEMQSIRTDVLRIGHEVTSRWINGDHQIPDSGLADQAKEEERTRYALEDLADLTAAELVISFTEEPRTTQSRGGRHVELGIALGMGKMCVVVGPRENVFHCLPQVRRFATWTEALLSLNRGEFQEVVP